MGIIHRYSSASQFFKLRPLTLSISESWETRIKSLVIAVAAIKISLSYIGKPLFFKSTYIMAACSILFKSSNRIFHLVQKE